MSVSELEKAGRALARKAEPGTLWAGGKTVSKHCFTGREYFRFEEE